MIFIVKGCFFNYGTGDQHVRYPTILGQNIDLHNLLVDRFDDFATGDFCELQHSTCCVDVLLKDQCLPLYLIHVILHHCSVKVHYWDIIYHSFEFLFH